VTPVRRDPRDEPRGLRQEHDAVVEVLRVLARGQADLQPVLDMIARMAGELSGAENCLLWLADRDLLHVRGAFGGKPGTLEYERAHPHRGDETHTLTGRVVQRRAVVGIPDVMADENYRWGSQTIQGFRALLGVPILADEELLGVLGISWAEPQVFTDHQVELVSAFAAEAALAITNARLFEAIERQRQELSRFLSPAIADLVSSEEGRRLLAGHRAYVTVLFADLRGFTAFAETAEPEELFDLLRDYHSAVGELIEAWGGTLEHFAGDGLMIFFNDPVEVPDHELRAARMATAMRDRIETLSSGWRKRGTELAIGIGVASGHATLGRIGFKGRFDYAAIGTVTILASRLSAAAQAGEILINQRLYAAIEDHIRAERTEPLPLKGFTRPVNAWRLMHTEPC
jgi:class 3 adenylate cyclase/putative methionine-R-sulfoxide reductase with GAF domain